MMNRKWIQKEFLIIGIILIIISAMSCIFGYRIREIWPTTIKIYEIGIPYIIGALGVILSVTFFSLSVTLCAKKKIIK